MALRKKRKTTAELALSCDIVRKYGQKIGRVLDQQENKDLAETRET